VRLPRWPQDRFLVEQLRLLYGNVGASVVPALLVAMLLVFTLAQDHNRVALLGWCAAVAASKLFTAWDARRQLAIGIAPDQARRLAWGLMLAHAVDGAAWGALAWVAMDGSSVASGVLVVAVLTGILGNSMSLLAPVLPVFVAFTLVMTVLLVSRLWLLGDASYQALGLAGILYLLSLLGQARNSARAAHAAIKMRFENLDLLEKLRLETDIAESAQRAAEEANLAKSKFLAAASHDLRQPIHAQGLFLDVLSRTALTPHQGEVLASARSASLASSEMLNTLLDFSRIEAGVVTPSIQPFHLQNLLHKIENDLAPLADAKGLVYRSRDCLLVVDSDASLVEMILRNLVSNAIRYTNRGGVLVACRTRGRQLVVEVWDTGMGIAKQHHAEIFREFHQLGNAERDRRKGLGLGLAIADGLARAMGLSLSLSSRLGRGTVFRLVLPLAEAGMAGQSAGQAPAPGLLAGRRILVIDDDGTVRAGMARLLESWGCAVDTAHSISVALALARIQAPDAIISDYRLRGPRTGAQAIAMLREQLRSPVSALIVTGDTAPQRLREALASGVPLLHKPLAPGQLYKSLVQALPRTRDTQLEEDAATRAPATSR
jgi:signal transduction histidine kinase/ActR/RegA family two-component response regulator